MEKKKILCVIGQLGNGGSEKQLYLFLKYLDKEKYEAKLFVTGKSGDYWEKRILEDTGIDIIYARKYFAFSKILAFRRCLKEFQPDVVYSCSFYANPLCYFADNLPFFGSLRTQYAAEKINLSPWRRWLSRQPGKMIANSMEIANDLISLGYDKENIKIICNIFESEYQNGKITNSQERRKREKDAIKQDFCQKYNIPLEAIILMGVGGISPAKDFPLFVDTFAVVKKNVPNLHAVIIGQGGLNVKQKVADLGLTDCITITGEIPHARRFLPLADIFFLSSVQEGMPNVLMEAIDAGCAILARDVGGVRELYSEVPKELFSKILVEKRDVDLAASMLLELVNNEPLRLEVAKLSEQIIPRFSPERIMPKYYEVLFNN